MNQPLDPQDVAALRMLAGANFLGGQVTLPSGRVLNRDEIQALASAYAPAFGEPTPDPELPPEPKPNRAARHQASDDMTGRMPLDGESLTTHYLANGGTPNELTMAILTEADRGRQRAHTAPSTGTPEQTAMRRRGVAWWGHNATAGTCACCQATGHVYRGYNGGQGLSVYFCARCKRADHRECGNQQTKGR